MAKNPLDSGRRKVLVTTAALLGGVGVTGTAVPFVESMLPSARARALGADVEVDIGGLQPGELKIVEWRGMPVWILRRTPRMLADLETLVDRLKDPDSEAESQQPPYARNRYRSIKPEYLVVVGICTHLGCSPTYRPQPSIPEVGAWWRGGFFCPCHYSDYDLAGRVFADRSPAPLNLPVPPHQYLSATRIRIGDPSG